MTTTATPVDNGVDVEFLRSAREALTAEPEGAKFQWRVTNTWINGTHSRSAVKAFFGLGEEQSHRSEFTYDGDHPELFAAEDHGATPVELVLVGLASCLTAGVAAVAQYRDIQLRSVSATLHGDMDVRGILGVDTTSATASAPSRSPTPSTPTPRPTRSKPWWPSPRSARRSTTSSPTPPTSPSKSADPPGLN